MIEEKKEPINDFLVWLELKKIVEDKFKCAIRFKEDDEKILSVLFDKSEYINDENFEKFVLDKLCFYFGNEIIERTKFSFVDENNFKIII